MRGRKLSCPKCRQSLVITRAGVAKRDEAAVAAPALRRPARNGRALLPLALAALLVLSAGLALGIFALSRGGRDEPTQVAQLDDAGASPGKVHKLPTEKPSQSEAPDAQHPPETKSASPGNDPAPATSQAPESALVPPPQEQPRAEPTPPPTPPVEAPPVETPPPPPETPAPAEEPVGVNLLVNGSFEEGPDPGDFLPLDPGSTDIAGWTVTRGQIDYIGTLWGAVDGNRSLDLNGSPGAGGVAQTFNTTPGRRYQVTFALAGNPGGDVTGMRLAVSAAGQAQEFDFDTAGKTLEDLGWQGTTWEFVATDTQTTLEIYSADMSDPIRGPTLDNVSVVALP